MSRTAPALRARAATVEAPQSGCIVGAFRCPLTPPQSEIALISLTAAAPKRLTNQLLYRLSYASAAAWGGLRAGFKQFQFDPPPLATPKRWQATALQR